MDGRIFQLNCSKGGVPKLAVRESLLTETGLECDRQADRRYHGGPERALCLFSLERILELQAEGHPVFPGSTGENVTVADPRGPFELNSAGRLLARNLLDSSKLLASAARLLDEKCVAGIEARREVCERYAELTLAGASALNP